MSVFLTDIYLDPPGPGYIYFVIVDLDFALRANWQVHRVDLHVGATIETKTTDVSGVALFHDLPYGGQHTHYFRVQVQNGVVHEVVIPSGSTGVIRLVQV